MTNCYYVGVDVGTGSVRAALIDQDGTIRSTAEIPLYINHPDTDQYEQSSDQIWKSCCDAVKQVTVTSSPESVQGIGFCATCSLVVLDQASSPLSVSLCDTTEETFDVIMWMDHRAQRQTDVINSTAHPLLRFVGGKMSLEMQLPKLLWLKENRPKQYARAGHFFDLPDFLTHKATGAISRSLCSVTCKWSYHPEQGWCQDFFDMIGLHDLTSDDFARIGKEILPPGCPVGSGLCSTAAAAMCLKVGTPVGASLIDAHCGGVGMVGADLSAFQLNATDVSNRLAIICGTSSCHMAVSKNPLFVPGVWGPYYAAMLPRFWLNEGGQSATGKLIDFVVETHPAYVEANRLANNCSTHVHLFLNSVLDKMAAAEKGTQAELLTRDLHVWPDYHGNRSPIVDSQLRGSICGLSLDTSIEDLAKKYLATAQALANGSRHIVEALEQNGHQIRMIHMCGGLSKNPLFVQVHANALRKPVVISKESETVLIGAGILGAVASQRFVSVDAAMAALSKAGRVVLPDDQMADFYERKYKVFLAMVGHQQQYRDMMKVL